eukprot:XP_011617840.1 PREDICTED: ubiquitin-conjugating enzyme E2 G2-like [Takifugu rubripes]
MAGTALKRLMAEYKQLTLNPPEGILAGTLCSIQHKKPRFSTDSVMSSQIQTGGCFHRTGGSAFVNPGNYKDGASSTWTGEESDEDLTPRSKPTCSLCLRGPQDTCFEGGIFPAVLSFPSDYPLSPPKMRFTCEMFHPNIYPDGRVCISILHAPGDDPMGYESSAERWSPVQSVEKILLSVVSMLAGKDVTEATAHRKGCH